MISEWLANHWESLQNNFRLICKSQRITNNHPKTIWDWFANHRELPQKWFQSGLWITENHHKTISDWLMNHWKLLRITPKMISEWFVNHQELLRITKNCPKTISDWFANHQELLRITENHPKNNFRVVYESLRITKKQFQTDLWITKNHWELPQNNFRLIHKSPRSGGGSTWGKTRNQTT